MSKFLILKKLFCLKLLETIVYKKQVNILKKIDFLKKIEEAKIKHKAGNFADNATEYMIYEASYSYPVNDGLTITPGVFVQETAGDDLTGIIVKSSFAF